VLWQTPRICDLTVERTCQQINLFYKIAAVDNNPEISNNPCTKKQIKNALIEY